MEFFFSNKGSNEYRLSFDKAASHCKINGGKLFEPKDTKTMNVVRTHAGKIDTGSFWLGIQDKNKGKVNRNFVYISDNSRIEIENWNEDEPNNYENWGEYCVETNDKNGKWNDIKCDHWRPFVCTREKRKNLINIKKSSKIYDQNVKIDNLCLR